MSHDARRAEKDSFSACDETCPDVDRAGQRAAETINEKVGAAIDELIDTIKNEATKPLREALTAKCLELNQCEDEKAELQKELDRVKRDCENYESEIAELTEELNNVKQES